MHTILNSLEHITPNETDLIVLNGGEPTLHKQFYDILNIISEKYNSIISVYTNGSLLDVSKIPHNIHIFFIVPIHGTEIIHDNITRVRDSFKKTLINLKQLDAKKINYKIKFIINNDMIHSFFSVKNFLYENNLQPNEIILARLNKTTKSEVNNVIMPQKAELVEYINKQIQDLQNNFIIKLLDIPFCFLKSINNVDTSINENTSFYFNDINHFMQSRKYYKDIMIGSNCSSCIFYKECLIMKHSYLTLVIKNNTLKIEME